MEELQQLQLESSMDHIGHQLQCLGMAPDEVAARLIIEARRIEREQNEQMNHG